LQDAITNIVATSSYRQKGSRTATTCLLMELGAVSQFYCKSAKGCRSSTHCTAKATVTVLQILTAQNRNKLSCMLQRKDLHLEIWDSIYSRNQLNQIPKTPDIADGYQHTQTGASSNISDRKFRLRPAWP